MPTLLQKNPAIGGPGIEPRWSRSDKDGVGTAYSSLSRIWFTISRGILNEVYYPTIDRPQIRDMQFLITDGKTFFHETRRHLHHQQEYLAHHTLGFRIISSDPEGRYRVIKEIISDPHLPCLLLHTWLEAAPEWQGRLRLFVVLAPHLEVGGKGNNGWVLQTSWGEFLAANKGSTWLVLAGSRPFVRRSCGYVGSSDGWQDLSDNFELDYQFDCALDGNIALTAEIDLSKGPEFLLGLAFGDSLNSTLVTLAQSLGTSFADHKARFIEQWQRAALHLRPGYEKYTGDSGNLYRKSNSLLLAHEDKEYAGAMIASLSIPWGEAKGDEDLGGYHLVWTRDMCNSALGLLAAGHTATPLRALIYLACTQRPDGGFYQNFWISGEAYWRGIQLDESAYPIILAWRLHQAKALQNWDPWPMVIKAADYLIMNGPVSPQERWEENSGYSPSTLAVCIAGLICAAAFARTRGLPAVARYLEEYADFLEGHLDYWTVTTQGTLVPGISRHFIRIHPIEVGDVRPDEDANHGMLAIRNRPPGTPFLFPATEIVDGGFLELVRFGIRKAGDALFEDSLRVLDAVLKVDTPLGPCWRRYSHDGYGQRADGGPFNGSGRGRAWPLLTGERGMYELAAGRAPRPVNLGIVRVATENALLPEQIWDEPDRPEALMVFGKPTGGAMPLMWAHSEYIKLVRSAVDGQVFDRVPEVADRYLAQPRRVKKLEIWKFNHQVSAMTPGQTLRIQNRLPFRLRWTLDEWQTTTDTDCTAVPPLRDYVDIEVPPDQQAPIRFTFFWLGADRWEGRDFEVRIKQTDR
jgi:glucoamylase